MLTLAGTGGGGGLMQPLVFFRVTRERHRPIVTKLGIPNRSGAHPRGGPRGPGPLLGPEKHYICRVSSVKLRDLHL